MMGSVNIAAVSPAFFLFHWSMIGCITASIILLVLYRGQISFSPKKD